MVTLSTCNSAPGGKHTDTMEHSSMCVVEHGPPAPKLPGNPVESVSQLQNLPQELLQSVLQRVPRTDWAAVRLVSRSFDASLAPLITTITIRQWTPAAPSTTSSTSSSSSSKVMVSTSSSLKHVQHLQAVVDPESGRPGDLQQVLQLLVQLKQVKTLTLRGLKPLQGLTQLLYPAPIPATGLVPCRTSHSSGSTAAGERTSVAAAAAARDALAQLTTLKLPDSSSSSLPKGLQLPQLASMSLFAVNSLQDLAAFTPNLQRLECFSLTIPAGPSGGSGPSHKSASAAAGMGCTGAGVLAPCRTLAAACIHAPPSSDAEAVANSLAHSMPALKTLATLPYLVQQSDDAGAGASPAQQPCEELTFKVLQQALPGLQLIGAASAC